MLTICFALFSGIVGGKANSGKRKMSHGIVALCLCEKGGAPIHSFPEQFPLDRMALIGEQSVE